MELLSEPSRHSGRGMHGFGRCGHARFLLALCVEVLLLPSQPDAGTQGGRGCPTAALGERPQVRRAYRHHVPLSGAVSVSSPLRQGPAHLSGRPGPGLSSLPVTVPLQREAGIASTLWQVGSVRDVPFVADVSCMSVRNFEPHMTRIVKSPVDDPQLVLPLRRRYWAANQTLSRVASELPWPLTACLESGTW